MSETRAALSLTEVVLKLGKRALNERLRSGEIVGLAGLDGHGQEAFLEAVAGLERPLSGEVRLETGSRVVQLRSFRGAARQGVAYLPHDRRTDGIFPNLSVLDNFAIASLSHDLRRGLINPGARRRRFEMFR